MESDRDMTLLADVRNYLDITWDDPQGDWKLCGMIERGKSYIDNFVGCKLDYTVEDDPRALLFDYVRYARADALDEFQTNYLHELLGLQMREEGARYAESEQKADV